MSNGFDLHLRVIFWIIPLSLKALLIYLIVIIDCYVKLMICHHEIPVTIIIVILFLALLDLARLIHTNQINTDEVLKRLYASLFFSFLGSFCFILIGADVTAWYLVWQDYFLVILYFIIAIIALIQLFRIHHNLNMNIAYLFLHFLTPAITNLIGIHYYNDSYRKSVKNSLQYYLKENLLFNMLDYYSFAAFFYYIYGIFPVLFSNLQMIIVPILQLVVLPCILFVVIPRVLFPEE